MTHSVPVIDRMIEQVRAAGTVNRDMVERATGTTLHETGESNRAFVFYGAAGIRSGEHILGIDLRMPRPGGSATAGPLLAVDVAGSCLGRTGLEERFGPLTLTQVPRGDSLDEKAYWSRNEKWGRLSFGFSERNPECLSSVVFRIGAE